MCNQSVTNPLLEYIAYVGNKFTVEWYYYRRSRSQSFLYYKKLTIKERARLLSLFKRMGDVGELKDKTKFNYEGDKIYTFKVRPNRFLCFFFENKRIVITNAFKKKCKKLPAKEKTKALNGKKDYMLRIKEGKYYE
jgi:hypothetical protein